MKDKKVEAYKQAIDILQKEFDWRKLVVQLAKDNPVALVESYDSLTGSNKKVIVKAVRKPAAEIDTAIRQLVRYNDGGKVDAIKMLRASTGMDLRPAKEYVDNLIGC